MLSDLASIFTKPLNGNTDSFTQSKKPKPGSAVHNLMFYAAYALLTPGPKMLEGEARQAGRRRHRDDTKPVRTGR